MRHAEAAPGGASDHDRELTEQGRAQASNVGLWMKRQEWGVDAIVASTAVRTMQTAVLVRDSLFAEHAAPEDVHTNSELYNCALLSWLEVVSRFPDEWDDVLVVGHNPAVQSLVSRTAGGSVPVVVATVADIRLPSWGELIDGGRAAGVYIPGGQNLLDA